MHRISAAIGALVLLLTACGSTEGGFRDELTSVGFSDETADCLIEELADRGLSVEDVGDQAIGDGDMPAGAQEAMTTCAGDAARVVDGDTDDDIMNRSLDAFEQAFVDGAMAEGATERAARCVLGELIARDLDLIELAIGSEELQEALLEAGFACGDELLDSDAFIFGTGDAYGDDPELDGLWDACADGDMNACDDLFLRSPIGSEYERFGATCGDTSSTTGLCGDGFAGGDGFEAPFTYGDDPELDGLWDGCADGDMNACDELYWISPIDSEYEDFGRTCGGLDPAGFGCVDEQAA